MFKIRVRLRESQVTAIHAAAAAMKTPFDAFLRTCAMRRIHRDKPATDPSVDVSFAVTPDEKLAIDRAASRCHVEPSQYVRESSLSAIADLVSRDALPLSLPPQQAREPHFYKDRAPVRIPPAAKSARSHPGKTEGRAHPGSTPGQNRGIG